MHCRKSILLVAILASLSCGCGGDEAPKKEAASDIQIRRPKGGVAQAPVEKPRAKPKQATTKEKPAPPPIDPDRTFVLADRLPNFELVPEEEAKLRQTYNIAVPSGGANSGTFDVVAMVKKPIVGTPDASFKLPKGFVAVRNASYSEDGRPLRIVCEADGKEMAFVPAGPVTLGAEGAENATPQIEIFLGPYYMDVTEVTVEQFENYREETKKSTGRAKPELKNAGDLPNFPALGMTWNEAQFYAIWSGKELPTEAEWEKAARTEAAFEHVWGNSRVVWERFRTPEQIDPVKSFRNDVSLYGIFDLAGNAREWVADWYAPDAFAQLEGEPRDWKGPRRATVENERTVKGNGPQWQTWHRAGANSAHQLPDIGVRCVLRLQD